MHLTTFTEKMLHDQLFDVFLFIVGPDDNRAR